MTKSKKMVQAIMTKWECSVCGGYESDSGKFSYGEEAPELVHESLLRCLDANGEGEPIDLCPRCIYKAISLIKDMLMVGEKGFEIAWMVKSPRKVRRSWWRKRK
jgi:hypothetical protein